MKAVIFDLDGTLVNSLEDLMDSTNYAMSKVGVKEINTLIHGSLAPERKAFTDIAEHRADAGRQISRK